MVSANSATCARVQAQVEGRKFPDQKLRLKSETENIMSQTNDAKNDGAPDNKKQRMLRYRMITHGKMMRLNSGIFWITTATGYRDCELLKSQLDQLKETKKRKPNPTFQYAWTCTYYARTKSSPLRNSLTRMKNTFRGQNSE